MTIWKKLNRDIIKSFYHQQDNIKINIFELDKNEEQLISIYKSFHKNINLLLYKNHYIWIKDINRSEF